MGAAPALPAGDGGTIRSGGRSLSHTPTRPKSSLAEPFDSLSVCFAPIRHGGISPAAEKRRDGGGMFFLPLGSGVGLSVSVTLGKSILEKLIARNEESQQFHFSTWHHLESFNFEDFRELAPPSIAFSQP